jgi:2-polyprenyl-3-methyl-5-hydroxy-6-metoxy-1,4-benzoquinol methylase
MSNWSEWRAEVDLDEYEARWQQMFDDGANPHGEADFIQRLSPTSALDAGCGTGRVGIELARRGIDVEGTDLDADMLMYARRKAPHITWHESNLSDLHLQRVFDVVALAGNVIPYVEPPDRAGAVAGAARHVAPGGHLVAGFTLRPDWPSLADYDGWCAAANLEPVAHYATWDSENYAGGDYVVCLHHKPQTEL